MQTHSTSRLGQDRAARRQADREYVQQAVERLRSSDGWQAWLQSRRHFHRYSLTNQLLIAAIHPTATRVAGFRAWLKLGYCVRKGEKSIRIWAPCPPSKQTLERWRADGADPSTKPPTRFRLAAVFAQDQVAPLPPPAHPAPVEPPIHPVSGDELAEEIAPLEQFALQLGCNVSYEPMPDPVHGYYQPSGGRIAIRDDLSANGKVKTLCHELAHALLDREQQDSDPQLDRAREELVVESVAYTCVGALGIDTEGYSIPYLASWTEAPGVQIEDLQALAGLIDRLAGRIESAVADQLEEALTPEGAGAQASQ